MSHLVNKVLGGFYIKKGCKRNVNQKHISYHCVLGIIMIDLNQVVTALQSVIDPNTNLNIVKAKLVSQLKTEENNIFFELDVTNITGDFRSKVFLACQEEIKKVLPGTEVHIHMKSDAPNSPKSNTVLPQVKNIIAVASGKGGVGKSTVSVNTALALVEQGYQVGLIDADLYGPSIPTMLNIQNERPKIKEVYGKHKIIPVEAYGLYTISIGLIIEPEKAVVLRGPRLSGVIKQFINECIWPDLDYLIIDLPPGTGDIQLTLVQTVPITGVIMVTTPQKVAVIDAVKAMNMFLLSNINVPILGVIENMSWFIPDDDTSKKYFIFGEGGGQELAHMNQTELLGKVPLVQKIREAGDAGQPMVVQDDNIVKTSFAEIVTNLIKQVNRRNETIDPTQIVQVSK